MSRRTDSGFTVVEMIVAIVVMSLFIGLLFQFYLTGISQRQSVTARAAANDIAMTNIRKITSKSSSLLSAVTCDGSLLNNQNNLTINSSAPGTAISFTSEPITNTSLPSSASQTMKALFPRGCDPSMPVEIISTVSFGTDGVSHATYVN